MNKYKKILAIIITLITLASMLLPVCTYATNGSATIYVIRPEDSDGNLITWYTTSKNIFMDKEKHYFNLYCIDAGINRNIDDVKIEEKHITNFCNIDNITKSKRRKHEFYKKNYINSKRLFKRTRNRNYRRLGK